MMDWIDFSLDQPPVVELETVHSPTRTIRLTRVILLTFFDKLPCKELKLTRNNVFERDKNSCQYCAKVLPREQLNLDHVIPRDYGGKTTWENIVTACARCNLGKGGRTPREADMHPRRHPRRPSMYELQEHGRRFPPNHLHESWLDYLYWDIELEA